jgi:hypothetical protein
MSRSARKKTVLRTLRITEELDELLQKDARSKGISVNALLSMVMTRYAEWDRFNEKFGVITLKKESFRMIISAISDEDIARISQELGSRVPSQFVLFWFKKASLDNYLKYVSLVCRYGGFAQYEIDAAKEEYTITLIHEFGEKWSNFLGNWLRHGMENTVSIIPKVDARHNSVVARFTYPDVRYR